MSIIEQLLVVQEYDLRIRDMEREIRDIPARQKLEQERLRDHKQALETADAALKQAEAKVKELELECQSCRTRIAKFRQQQMELKSNKEFKAMETEIQNVEAEIRGLEDKELVLMEQVEAARSDVAVTRAAFDEENRAVQQDMAMLDERCAGIKAELEGLLAERNAKAVHIPSEWITYYDRVRTNRADALVRLADGICGGCHMKLPAALTHATHRTDNLVTCNFCGRLLYA